jgi:hypothetical protein
MAQAKALVMHNREERNALGTMMKNVASSLFICKLARHIHPVTMVEYAI